MAANKLKPEILEIIFSYLSISDLRNCSLVCKHWYKYLNDENNDVWRFHCVRKLAEEALKSDLLKNVPTYKAKLRAFYHAWNPNDCSKNMYVKSNGFSVHRNPIAQSTDGARGKIGFRSGRHCWEVWWEGPLGTIAMIGLATKYAPLYCHGYVGLLGGNDQTWGWNLVDNFLLHNGDSQGNYPTVNNAPKYQVMGWASSLASSLWWMILSLCIAFLIFKYIIMFYFSLQVGERIRVILDCEDNTLAFEKNYEFLGKG